MEINASVTGKRSINGAAGLYQQDNFTFVAQKAFLLRGYQPTKDPQVSSIGHVSAGSLTAAQLGAQPGQYIGSGLTVDGFQSYNYAALFADAVGAYDYTGKPNATVQQQLFELLSLGGSNVGGVQLSSRSKTLSPVATLAYLQALKLR